MNSITATLMTYGADIGEMVGGLAALATLCLPFRRPRGKHRKRRGRPRKGLSSNGTASGDSGLKAAWLG